MSKGIPYPQDLHAGTIQAALITIGLLLISIAVLGTAFLVIRALSKKNKAQLDERH